jgi:hypothetical protein
MERPYANGVGYRLVVDLFHHHVAFTTHPFNACLGIGSRRTIPRRSASDCSVANPLGQSSMSAQSRSDRNRPLDVSTRQRLRACAGWLAVTSLLISAAAPAQIFDSLDTHPPRWHLDHSDCDARVSSQGHLADGGVGGGACESITFVATHGTEALLVYPIEPTRPMDDLTANVSVMSARGGARIGLRIRYPYIRDAETRRPISVVVYGASYQSPGEFASIGVGMIERAVRLKHVAVRREHGSTADLSDAYVDGIVINAYSGPGTTALRMDELRVDGLIPVSESVITGSSSAPNSRQARSSQTQTLRVAEDASRLSSRVAAFPPGKVTRILQHNGEPLSWVRSLGFDAVLLAGPVDSVILSEAIRARMLIYAPPPSSPDPSMEPLLEPVAGWYIGSGEAMDSRQVDQTAITSDRLRGWPSRWQRPLVGAPSETWRSYAPLLDAIIDDLPPRGRGIRGGEEVVHMTETRRKVGDRVETGVGIVCMPPESMVRQTESIADAIGAPRPEGFRWHSMWLQAMRGLEATPAAILFRSTRPLSSGASMDNQRAMALSYVNRMIAMIAPWVSSATPSPPPGVVGAPYRCTRLTTDATDMLILTSTAARGSEVLAGDGETIDILLTPGDASKTAWRMTHFSAQRMTPENTSTGARLQIVSPDAAEIIVLSSDPSVGASLSLSAQRFARQAGLDRWQLASDLVRRTRENWRMATSTRAADRSAPTNLVDVAERTLTDAEPMYRAGDIDASLRMARRADAWALRSEWQLAEALMPDWPRPTSCPPIDLGAAEIQTFWRPLMDEEGWGKNRLTSGSLDSPDLVSADRWNFGRRMASRADSEVMHVRRGTYQGPGALRARVTPIADDVLPGGYEGTVIQIRSPSVRVAAGKAIRIDVAVRTLGFGSPHQGLLVYDTIGGQEMGVLVRGRSDWTPVRLYRQAVEETEVSVMFELIGAGEATIDDVRLSLWEPQDSTPVLRPLAEIETPESTRR